MTDVLVGEHLSVRFRGLTALDDVSLSLPSGRATGLIGPNGAGKTTLVNVLSGLLAPTSGTIRLRGEVEGRHWSLSRAARHGVTRTFQATRVFGNWTVIDNLGVGFRRNKLPFDPLDVVDLAHRRNVRAGSLSYGELRRLGVAIALATGPDVMLLDEPGAGLTGGDLQLLSAAILRVAELGCAVMLVDHNMRFLMQTVEHVLMLEGGRLIAEGTPEQIQNDDRVRAAYLGATHDS